MRDEIDFPPEVGALIPLVLMYFGAIIFCFIAGNFEKDYSECDVKNRWHYFVIPHEYSCKFAIWMNEKIR
jgi:hypothetical protein